MRKETAAAGLENQQRFQAGDRQAFEALVSQHLAELFAAAEDELAYRQAVGELNEQDLNVEELVGDTLLRAWHDRHRRPPTLGTRPWLLGLLYRVAEAAVRRKKRLREMVAVALEERFPEGQLYDEDSAFWEWYQPDEVMRWEDALPAEGVSLGQPPLPELAAEELEVRSRRLAPLPRQVLVLCDVHGLSLAETAAALNIPEKKASQFLAEARQTVSKERSA